MKKVIKLVGGVLLFILAYNAISNLINPLPEYEVIGKMEHLQMKIAQTKGHTQLAYMGDVILEESIPEADFKRQALRIMEKERLVEAGFYTTMEAWKSVTYKVDSAIMAAGYMGRINTVIPDSIRFTPYAPYWDRIKNGTETARGE